MSVATGVDVDNEIAVRLSGDLLHALDRFIEEHDGREDRPQAVALALREWAHAKGYLREPGDEGLRPEDLSAANDG